MGQLDTIVFAGQRVIQALEIVGYTFKGNNLIEQAEFAVDVEGFSHIVLESGTSRPGEYSAGGIAQLGCLYLDFSSLINLLTVVFRGEL